jgi:hypothetical protein
MLKTLAKIWHLLRMRQSLMSNIEALTELRWRALERDAANSKLLLKPFPYSKLVSCCLSFVYSTIDQLTRTVHFSLGYSIHTASFRSGTLASSLHRAFLPWFVIRVRR